jgi:hypothetical protein
VYDTQSADDFIKEGRDYRKVEFGNPLISKENKKRYSELVKKIAAKRLNSVSIFNNKSIVDFLGEEEDLEKEAKEIVNGKRLHIETYLKEINKSRKLNLQMDNISWIINENPLFEMECLRLLLKGEDIEYVKKAFNDYKNRKESSEAKKFSNDYNKKYKLSFVIILCSIYKIEKKRFYGFVDYCHLSSGIIGYFLELCRRTFDIAFFRDSESLMKNSISDKIQTEAAYEYAYSEHDMIQRIAKFGSKLKVFIDNIGNTFTHIHKDLYLRYPETNQFPVSELDDENKQLLNLACMWSLIIKKPNVQDVKAGNKKQDIYILNRILAPVYKISYRTRGGLNPVQVTNDYFKNDFKPSNILSNTDKHKSSYKQMGLFDEIKIIDNIDE